jgi:hypothetical protein
LLGLILGVVYGEIPTEMCKNKMLLSLDKDTIVQEVVDGKARSTPKLLLS